MAFLSFPVSGALGDHDLPEEQCDSIPSFLMCVGSQNELVL